MANNKRSNQKSLSKKKTLDTQPLSESTDKVKKRKAKRKKGFIPLKEGESMKVKKERKISAYNIVTSAISDWCKRNGARCSRKEISEIYQGLKQRYANQGIPFAFDKDEVEKALKERLSQRGRKELPTQFKEFNWFDTPSLFNMDGGYFKNDDILRFDLSLIRKGILEIEYSELNDVYREQIYIFITEVVDEYEQEFGEMPSPIPQFSYNEEFTDLENRIYQWDFISDKIGDFEGTSASFTPKGKEEKKEPSKKGKGEPKEKEKVESSMELEVRQLEAKNKAKELLIEEYKLGLIDKDTYLREVSKL